MSQDFLFVFLAFLLVILNGFFVAAEFSLVKLRATKVRSVAKRLGWRGRLLSTVHGQLDAYLSACQLGITLASLGLGWIGEPAFAHLLTPLLEWIGIENSTLVHTISFFGAFFTISFLHIVLGELVPKTLAIRSAATIGIWTAPLLYGFYWLMFPAIWLLNQSANLFISLLNLSDKNQSESQYSTDELKLILRSSRPNQHFSADEWRVLAQAIDFRELDIADLMHPVSEMISFKETQNFDDHMGLIHAHRFSRYPYLLEDGYVSGMVHVKDVLMTMSKDPSFSEMKSIARPVQTVHPDTAVTSLFRKLKNGASHFALVAYDDNPPIGFVTLDDLLSALVGDIRDEFRKSHTKWNIMDDGSLLGKGTLSLHTLERTLGIDIEVEEADTVAGLILETLGELPKRGQKIEFDQFDVVVKKMTGPKISLVRVFPHKKQAPKPTSTHH